MIQNYKDLIGYPELNHPIAKEKEKIKIKYLDLIAYLINKYVCDKIIAKRKIGSLAYVLLGQREYTGKSVPNPKRLSGSILKTRFSRFRFFSYRYLFFFDCLFLAAIDDVKIAKQIEEEVGLWIGKRHRKELENMIQLMYQKDGCFLKKMLLTEDMIKAWQTMIAYLTSNSSKIVFTATMSAGKSTLINAIIGQKISDTKKAACTSHILEIGTLPLKRKIYTLYDGRDVLTDGTSIEIKDDIKKLNRNCVVYGYFESVLTTSKVKLVDTPGIDSARNPEHKKLTKEVLANNEYDALVYIISVENYGNEDDYNYLLYILKHVNYKNIIFLVNMIDTCNFEDDSIESILYEIRGHLCSIGYKEPQVYPISAKAGYGIKRRICKENVSENEKYNTDMFVRMFKKDAYNLSRFYGSETLDCSVKDDAWKAFENTGLPAFERLLLHII